MLIFGTYFILKFRWIWIFWIRDIWWVETKAIWTGADVKIEKKKKLTLWNMCIQSGNSEKKTLWSLPFHSFCNLQEKCGNPDNLILWHVCFLQDGIRTDHPKAHTNTLKVLFYTKSYFIQTLYAQQPSPAHKTHSRTLIYTTYAHTPRPPIHNLE